MKSLSIKLVSALSGACLLCVCAPQIHPRPVTFQPSAPTGQIKLLVDTADGRPESGSVRALLAGTELRQVGVIPEGAVYRAINHEIQLRAGDRYEAYLVASGTSWRGFYLPSEHGFLPLKQQTELQWTDK